MNTKTRKTGARLGALLLSLCLLVGLLPTTAFAAETDPFIFGYKSGAAQLISHTIPKLPIMTIHYSDWK